MSKERKKGHIVLQTEDKCQSFLYVIGIFEPMNEVIHFIDSQEPEIIEIVKQNKQSGIRQLVCAYKELTSNEVNIFQEAYHKDSKYLGLIGLEETVSIDTKLAVTALKHAGIKI